MKRFFAVLIIGILAITIGGCGKKSLKSIAIITISLENSHIGKIIRTL